MSGLLDDLLGGPNQSSQLPLLGPLLGGNEEPTATPAFTGRLPLLPTGTPAEESPSPSADPDGTDNDQTPGDNVQASPSQPQPTTTPTRPRPTFIITETPPSETALDPASSALPAPLTPSALPTLPSTPGPDDVLIVAPPPASTSIFPTADTIPTTLLLQPSASSSLAPSGTPLPSADAEASLADPGQGGSAMASLMPALPISLGVGGGVLFFGVFAGLLYKKGKWPFRGDRTRDEGFEELEDGGAGAAEKRFQRKWDPRVSGVGVFATRTNGATNF